MLVLNRSHYSLPETLDRLESASGSKWSREDFLEGVVGGLLPFHGAPSHDIRVSMWGYGAGGAELVDASLGWRLEGHECGILLSAIAHGSIVVVEIRFFVGEKTYSGMFELPLHVFKKDGDFLTSSTAIKDFVGRGVWMTVNNRYQFNGISLSNAREIDLCDDVLYAERKSASVDVVPK